MNKVKIGYIRYENIKKNIFEVSLAIKQDYTGLGLGTKMLNKSLKKYKTQMPPHRCHSRTPAQPYTLISDGNATY